MLAPRAVAATVLALALVGGGSAASSVTPRHSVANTGREQRPRNAVVPSWSAGSPVRPWLPGTPLPQWLPGNPAPLTQPGGSLPYLNSGCTGRPFRDSLTAPSILVQTCFVAP